MSPLDRERYLALALTLLGIWLVTALGRRRRSRAERVGAWVLLVGSVVWLWQHNPYEGPTVVGVGTHGLALADLGAPMWLAVAGSVLWSGRRRG